MAASILVPWLIAGGAVAIAIVAIARARAAARDAGDSDRKAESLRDQLTASRERLEDIESKRRRAGEELVDLRHKLDKAKKRATRTDGRPQHASPAGSQDFEKDLEIARQARDAAREEVQKLSDEVARLRSQVRSDAARKPILDNAAIEALQGRATRLEAELGELAGELGQARKEAARLREKNKTQEQLYVSIRGELQAKKDRLRTQTEELERIRALKVVLNGSDT
jgi:chromosome segregation ATPase